MCQCLFEVVTLSSLSPFKLALPKRLACERLSALSQFLHKHRASVSKSYDADLTYAEQSKTLLPSDSQVSHDTGMIACFVQRSANL